MLPDWLNGYEDFAEVLKDNADTILDLFTAEDKEKLFALLPRNNGSYDQEKLLEDLLKDNMTRQFGSTPL